MSAERTVVVLDALYDDLAVEREAAAPLGWEVARWGGDVASLRDAHIVIHVRTAVDRALIERMPRLLVIGRYGTGLDTVDLEAAAERGIRVVGVRDYCTIELATHTLGLAFALDRRIDAVRGGGLDLDTTWQEVSARMPIPGRTSATVVGLGTIGRAVGLALIACGLDVRVVTAHGAGEALAIGAEPVGLEEGLAGAGFVFLHAALSAETRALMDRSRLALMSADAILVDTARLGLIDEAAVAEALRADRLAGVALDARLAPDSPLRALLGDPRLLVTPHIGWYSERSARELRERVVRESIAALGHAGDAAQGAAADARAAAGGGTDA